MQAIGYVKHLCG